MVAGRINHYKLSHLMLLERTMNQFSYGQAWLFYKDDIEKIKREHKVQIIFDQDRAFSHRSKSNIFVLDKLFTKEGWIQNPHNSTNLVYLFEKLQGIINPGVK